MADNVLAMTLRMRNTAVTTARNLGTEVRKTGNEATRMGTKFGKAVKASRTSVGGLMGSMVSLKTIIIATFAYRAVQIFGRFIGSLTDLFKTQETATKRLAESLAGYGNYTREITEDLHDHAEALQNVTGVANELIEEGMALLASFGMEGREIKKVTGLVMDFARAKDVELRTAFDLVGKASVGYTGTLARYGIILDNALSQEEKYAAALQELAAYKGIAAGVTETYSGKISVLGEQYSDMKKSMGAVIAQAQVQSGLFVVLGNAVSQVYEWFKKWKPLLSDIAATGMESVINKLKRMIVLMKDDTILAWLITVTRLVQFFGKSVAWVMGLVSDGLQQASILLADFLSSVFILGQVLTTSMTWADGMREYRDMVKESRIESEALGEESLANSIKHMEWMDKAVADISLAMKGVSEGDLYKRLADSLEEVNNALRDQQEALSGVTKNRERDNAATEDSFKLTQAMARQYALSSRLEQEQTKYLLGKISSMSEGDIGGLSEMEKKLISKQGILKEQLTNLFGEYSERVLGIEASFLRESKTTVEIDLTEEAKELLKVSKIESQRTSDRNYERSLAS